MLIFPESNVNKHSRYFCGHSNNTYIFILKRAETVIFTPFYTFEAHLISMVLTNINSLTAHLEELS